MPATRSDAAPARDPGRPDRAWQPAARPDRATTSPTTGISLVSSPSPGGRCGDRPPVARLPPPPAPPAAWRRRRGRRARRRGWHADATLSAQFTMLGRRSAAAPQRRCRRRGRSLAIGAQLFHERRPGGHELLGRHGEEPAKNVHPAPDGWRRSRGHASIPPPPCISIAIVPGDEPGRRPRRRQGVNVSAIVWILIIVAVLVILAVVVLVMRARSRGRMIMSRRQSSRRTGGQP
jgi:hypothetical protein